MQHGFIRSNLLIIVILVHIGKYTTYLICKILIIDIEWPGFWNFKPVQGAKMQIIFYIIVTTKRH